MNDPGVNQEICRRVEAALKQRGWTGTRLAEEAGMDRNSIMGKVRGRRAWSVAEVAAVARALGVEVGELYAPVSAATSFPGVLKAYLESTGWVVRDRYAAAWVLEPPKGVGDWSPVLVPFDASYADYGARLGEAMRLTARWEAAQVALTN